MWPEIPDAAYFSAKSYIVFILKFLSSFCRIVPIFIFASIYNVKKKDVLAEKIILWVLLFICAFYSVLGFSNFNKVDLLWIISSSAVFFLYIFFKPVRPKKILSTKYFSYYFLVILVLFQFVNQYKLFSGFIFPFNAIVMIVLACYSCRVGWKGFILGAVCGLNIWSAIWWFFCLPNSIVCKCKNCGAKTFSNNKICPSCKQILEYEIYSLTSRFKINIRPGAVIAVSALVIIFLSIFCVKKLGFLFRKNLNYKHLYDSYIINVVAPYNFKDVVILKDNNIIGTNSVINITKGDGYLKPITYQQNGEKLFGMPMNNMSNITARVAKQEWEEKAEQIYTNLIENDYYIDKIQKEFMPDCDGTLLQLAYKMEHIISKNLSLYNCYDFMFSNFWFSLNVKQRKDRFNYYFSSLNFPDSFLGLLSKYSELDWFKSNSKMPIIEPQVIPGLVMQTIYNEDQIKDSLFSKKFQGVPILVTEYPSVCASPLIRKICANYTVRTGWGLSKKIEFDIYRSEKVVLPYLRTQKLNLQKFNLYLKILAMNPDSFTEKDFEKIKFEVLKDRKISLNLGGIAALDRPELWDLIKNPKKNKNKYQNYFSVNNFYQYFPREIKSTNAFEICLKLEKERSPSYLNPFFVNVFSRIKNEKAVNKVRQEIQNDRVTEALINGDAINRIKIIKIN